MNCVNCNDVGWFLEDGVYDVKCEECSSRAPQPSNPDCSCNTCNGTGWVFGDVDEYQYRSYSVCNECNNLGEFRQPDAEDCYCPICNSSGWISEFTSLGVETTQCYECNNRCNLLIPDCSCEECGGQGWIQKPPSRYDGYIRWEECRVCENKCNIVEPNEIPTWNAPAAGGKSKYRKSKGSKIKTKRYKKMGKCIP